MKRDLLPGRRYPARNRPPTDGGCGTSRDAVASTATFLPAIDVLWVFYLATGLSTSVISTNANVMLMIPVTASIAQSIGANAFAFVLAVTFVASTAFMTLVGYQTNLFVCGPGGYTFSGFLRVGAPLQFLLSIVTVLGTAFFWGIRAWMWAVRPDI